MLVQPLDYVNVLSLKKHAALQFGCWEDFRKSYSIIQEGMSEEKQLGQEQFGSMPVQDTAVSPSTDLPFNVIVGNKYDHALPLKKL